MTNMKSTKRALLASIMALFLCFTMLLGTTFAWFTDSVTSTGNIIQSGNLKIEMHWAEGSEAIPADDSADWADASAGAIFNYDKWEPGYVEVRHIRIANKGSLALKYLVSIEANGEVSDLADVIDVYYADPALQVADRAALAGVTKLGTLTQVLANLESTGLGVLNAGESDVITIALKMQETAGNSYMNKSIGSDFAVKVFATQANVEGDSFGTGYDEGAYLPVVYSAEELQAALTDGQNVKLGADVTATETVTVPAGVEVTLDLNGKTLENGVGRDADGNRVHALVNEGTLVLKNGTVKSTGTNGGSAVYNHGTLTLDNVTAQGAPSDLATGYASYTVNTDGAGSELTVNSSNVSGRGAIGATNGAKVTVNGGTYKVPVPEWGHCIYADGANTEVTINGGDFSEGFDSAPGDYSYMILAGNGAKVVVYGGTFSAWDSDAAKDYCELQGNGTIELYSGTFGSDPTEFAKGTVIDNGDGTFTVTLTRNDVKEIIGDALAEAVANGETEVEVDLGGNDIGGLEYGLNTSLVPAGTTVTIKNANVSDQSYGNAVDGTVVFENCVFNNKNGAYSIHFDAGSGHVVFKNCTLAGWCSFGAAIQSVTLEGCKLEHNGHYGHIRFYQDVTMTDTVAASDVTIDAAADSALTLTDCSVENGDSILSAVYVDDCFTSVTVNGKEAAFTKATFDAKAAANDTVYVVKNDAGEIYDLNGNQKDGLTVIGLEDDVKLANNTNFAGGGRIGAIWKAIHLENVTLTNTVYTMDEGGNATFKNVNFAAGFREGYGKGVVFTDCTFGSNAEGYALHFQTDSASAGGNIQLNGCTFEGGKVHLGGKRAYTFTGCAFAEGTDFQVWSTVTLNGCTVNGETVTAANAATLFPKLDLSRVTIQ